MRCRGGHHHNFGSLNGCGIYIGHVVETQPQPQGAAEVNTIEIHIRDSVTECTELTEEKMERALEATRDRIQEALNQARARREEFCSRRESSQTRKDE
jgi:hypothetical protein